MTLTSADKSYFLSGSPKGIVIGLKVPGEDDHLTMGTDGEEISQVHRTVNGREDWRLTSEAFQAEADSFLANNTISIEPSSISPDSHIISLDKANVAFSVLQSILLTALPLLIRLISTTKFKKTENCVEGWIAIEPNKIRHLANSARIPLAIVFPILRRIAPIILPPLIRRMARHVLIPTRNLLSLGDDIAVIISNERIGIMWQNENCNLCFIPLAAIFEVFQRIERNQPLGKLNQLATPNLGAIRLSAKSWL